MVRKTATEVVVAVEGFALEIDSVPFAVARGSRLRADHPAVRLAPQKFVPDGTPEAEWPTILTEPQMLPDQLVCRTMGRVPALHQLRATRGETFELAPILWEVHPGEVFDARDEVVKAAVKAHPGLFEPVTDEEGEPIRRGGLTIG